MTHDVSGDARNDAPETVQPEATEENEIAGAEEPSELERAQAEAKEIRERYLRLAAELDNVRKRAARELENARKYGLERLAQALLPVRDSLEAGVAAADNADAAALLEGKRATLRLLDAALEQAGIHVVDPEGEPFDPACHEAITTQPSSTAEPETVLSVIQKGYSIHDRLLRPARVVVATEPEEAGE
ncbi:MAG TPA: nucleotide exchange factor GrpE [Gammaproteobacteria bacterium]